MELNAKYKIGDWLYLKQDIEGWKRLGEQAFAKPKRVMVLEIIYHECYAGIQISYGFHGYHGETGARMDLRYLEIELTDTLE